MLCDGDDERDFGLDGFDDGGGGGVSGDEDGGGVWVEVVTRETDGGIDGEVEVGLACWGGSGGDSADDVGAVGECGLGVGGGLYEERISFVWIFVFGAGSEDSLLCL